MTRSTGKLADPAWRQERAKKARAAQDTPEYRLNYWVAQVVANAPKLTPDQLDQLRSLLASIPTTPTQGDPR